MGLLERVPVADVSDQLPRRREGRLAVLALERPDAGVGVDVVVEGSVRLKAPVADVTQVRPVLAMGLHVARQQVPLGGRVAAMAAGQARLHLPQRLAGEPQDVPHLPVGRGNTLLDEMRVQADLSNRTVCTAHYENVANVSVCTLG